ncbi:MAG TPA: PA14 domain-containing protein [Lunatimonas sp.]|nr:PA14 domain-containing protein [Lunatimonas sp.]
MENIKCRTAIIGIILLFLTGGGLFAQLECENDFPDNFPPAGNQWNLVYPMGAWNAFVFQLDSDYSGYNDRFGRDFSHSSAQPVYKGFLQRDGNEFLPVNGLNFDTRFGSNPLDPALEDDAYFFQTGNTPLDSDGCLVRRSHFGLWMRARYIVPESGVYRVRVGSDDGSYMRMFKKPPFSNDVLLQDVNGEDVVHNNWVKIPADPDFDGYYNFLYESNIRNYYVELTAGDEIYIDLNYYEKTNVNRLSYNMELYYGPGEIRINNALETTSETYCAITPDPDPFFSKGFAVFKDGILDAYSWEWSLNDDPNGSWNIIENENDPIYKIPTKDYSGTRYFRRKAQGTVEIDGVPEEVTTYSNILQININQIEYPGGGVEGLSYYGTDAWHGYVYDGVAKNQADYFGSNPEKFLGKHLVAVGEDLDFVELFPTSNNKFTPNLGGSCGLSPDNFSVQFLRKFEVEPGTYEFTLSADDGYRFFIDDILISDPSLWNPVGAAAMSNRTYTYIVDEPATVNLRLEYFEQAGGQRMNFGTVFKALPVEWGQVSGNACGESNCLTWETLQEKNTRHFTVERSYHGQEWTPVGDEVAARGFSTESNTYQVSDATFLRERSFYRVKQVDLDGTMDYSEIIRIDNHSFRNKLLPYPNPTVDRVRFYSAEEVLMIQVTSHDARVNTRANFEQIDQNIYELDFSQMQNSHYVITIVTKDSRKSHKIIKK